MQLHDEILSDNANNFVGVSDGELALLAHSAYDSGDLHGALSASVEIERRNRDAGEST